MTLSQLSHFLFVKRVLLQHQLEFGIFAILNILFWKNANEIANAGIGVTGDSQIEARFNKTIRLTWCRMNNFRRTHVSGFYYFHPVIIAEINFETLAFLHTKLQMQRALIPIQLHFVQNRGICWLINLSFPTSQCLLTGNPAWVHNSRQLVLDLFDFALGRFEHFGEIGECLLHFSSSRGRLAKIIKEFLVLSLSLARQVQLLLGLFAGHRAWFALLDVVFRVTCDWNRA